jgi:isochorismate pyruvate lyase
MEGVRAASLRHVRRSIDRIDRRLVRLLAERGALVKAAARFKRTAGEVRAPARVAEVLRNVRRLSRRHGLAPGIAERVYRAMIAAFIRFEMAEHSRLRGSRARRARKERT